MRCVKWLNWLVEAWTSVLVLEEVCRNLSQQIPRALPILETPVGAVSAVGVRS